MTAAARPGRVVFEAHPDSTIGLPIPDRELTLAGSLRWSAATFGSREACVFEGRRWTYGELLADAERCARALVACGVEPGDHVGVLLGGRPEFISLVYGIAMAGGVTVMISTFSTAEELDWILEHSDASLLFMHARVRDRVVAADFARHHPAVLESPPGHMTDPTFPRLRRVVVVNNTHDQPPAGVETWDQFIALGDATDNSVVDARVRQVQPTDNAMLLYTSGSTAHPKAVMHMHRAPVMQGYRMADCLAIGRDDRTWSTFPVFWSAGWTTAIAGPIAVGATIILQEFYDPADAIRLIESERVTSVRQMIHDEMRLVAAHTSEPRDLSSVEVGVVTEQLKALTGVAYEVTEICAWGMTETFTISSMLPFDAPYELRHATNGRAVSGNKIRIRDVETGETVPAGQLGEITVAGMSLMRGYYKAEPTLPLDDAGYLPTSDSGYLTDEGYLIFTGRLDRLIKTAGVNVSPIEIEEQVQRWGRLGTCVVIGVPHPSLGKAIVLCAAAGPGSAVSAVEVKDYLRSNLASYKVPREVLFFAEDEMALTISSKVRANEMMDLAVARLLAGDLDRPWRELLADA